MARSRLLRRSVPDRRPRRAIVRIDRRQSFHHPWDAAAPLARSATRERTDRGMIKAAITGSIGMGKSTVAAMFGPAGIPLFDSDAEVHRLQGPGGPLLGAIEQRFPGTV